MFGDAARAIASMLSPSPEPCYAMVAELWRRATSLEATARDQAEATVRDFLGYVPMTLFPGRERVLGAFICPLGP